MTRAATSLPPREAWIEILSSSSESPIRSGRFPRGKRGLKCVVHLNHLAIIGRFPRGKRGLKFKAKRIKGWLEDVASPAGSVD